MQAYWEEGTDDVSINEICRRAKVSKPGLYREFGNEDGLMKAALLSYQKKVLTPMVSILATDTPFRETLDNLVSFFTTMNDDPGIPKGCLLVKMRESRMRIGDVTQEQMDHTHEQVLTAYEDWIARSKAKGEFTADIPTEFAATYIDTQISNALSLLARGEPNNTVRAILTMALSMIV
jgi:AcrR family transcriptional regulator